MYTTPMVPPMSHAKGYRAGPDTKVIKLLPPPPPSAGTPCVTVKTVAYRRPPSISSSVTSESSRSATGSPPARRTQAVQDHIRSLTEPRPAPSQLEPQPKQFIKKDPMSSLFMPKHRAHSQRPIQPIRTK